MAKTNSNINFLSMVEIKYHYKTAQSKNSSKKLDKFESQNKLETGITC